ncbi:MAG: DUF4388 domain-containing protein [Deltaproteobacteria bacterium]|nr:DUF4388 domain-containing protein [Deltaproteobacteria bacterium]
MDGVNLTVERQNDALLIAGFPEATEQSPWRAELLDENRILLRSDDMLQNANKQNRGTASLSVFVMRDFLIGLAQSGFSGVVAVDTGFGVKRLFLNDGKLVFAGSNLIDDRLGEVLFRESKISLDDLTSSAAEVTKVRKFGQVLVSSSILTKVDLWDALKLQVRQILRSIFMSDQLFCEIHPVAAPPSTEVVFAESFAQLVQEAFSYGAAYRAFLSRLRAETEVALQSSVETLQLTYPAGTFYGDIISLIAQERSVQTLLDQSKLIDAYTVGALMHLVNSGICKIIPDNDPLPKMSPTMAALKNTLDSYAFVLQSLRKVFTTAQKDFPIADLRNFIERLNDTSIQTFFVDDLGNLERDCVISIISQSQDSLDRLQVVVNRIESVIQFMLQITGDHLDFKAAQAIRHELRTGNT